VCVLAGVGESPDSSSTVAKAGRCPLKAIQALVC
jgi:hypothetical protein